MAERYQTFREFFPYYLGEHRNPTCRMLHFGGTTAWLAILIGGIRTGEPLQLAAGLGAAVVLMLIGWQLEKKGKSIPFFLLTVVAIVAANPPVLILGPLVAYGFAWAGHFLVEKNRPATFKYPYMSLAGDHVMWFKMLMGKLWRGDSIDDAGAAGADA